MKPLVDISLTASFYDTISPLKLLLKAAAQHGSRASRGGLWLLIRRAASSKAASLGSLGQGRIKENGGGDQEESRDQ